MRSSVLFAAIVFVSLPLTSPGGLEAQPSIVLKDGGLEFPDGSIQTSAEQPLLNHVRVGVAGGDYQSIQDAVDDHAFVASATNPILVEVAPGVFSENVTLAPHVHLAGMGQGVSIVSASGVAVTMAANSSIRDLTVRSEPAAAVGVGVQIPSGATNVSLLRVTAISHATTKSIGIHVDGGEAVIAASTATSFATGDSNASGCRAEDSGTARFRASHCEGNDDTHAVGLWVEDEATAHLEGAELVALGDGSGVRRALFLQTSGVVVARGGTFTATGGEFAWGVYAQALGFIDLTGTRVTGSGAAVSNRGVHTNGVDVRLRDCYVTGSTESIRHSGGSTLVAQSQLQGPIEKPGHGTLDCWDNYRVTLNLLIPSYEAATCP